MRTWVRVRLRWPTPATARPRERSVATQPTVAVSQLLRPYPQYGDLNLYGWPGARDHYYALQMKAERPMARGLTFVVAYNYNQEYHTDWYNSVDYYNNKLTMFDRGNPRHNLRAAVSWEVPIGKGRQFLSNMPKGLDYLIGGWATSHLLMWNGGPLLQFGQMNAPASAPSSSRSLSQWFDTTGFSQAAAYTSRTNPWYYDGLRGPRFWNLDSTLVKYFQLTERFKLEIRMEFYNMPNKFMPSQPDMGVTSSTFGKSTWVAGGNYGREIQYNARIHF